MGHPAQSKTLEFRARVDLTSAAVQATTEPLGIEARNASLLIRPFPTGLSAPELN